MPIKTRKKIRRMAVMGILAAAAAGCLLIMGLWLAARREQTPQTQTSAPTESMQATPEQTEPTLPQSEYSADSFAWEGEFLVCTGENSRIGVDVSHHQGVIDWAQVKQAGVDFVMVRLGYRGLTTALLYADDYVQENLTGAREAGLLVGGYFFSQATCVEEAREEAEFALEILGDFALDLPLVFDWEVEDRTAGVDRETATMCTLEFCRTVEQAGVQPMVYFNNNQARNHVDLSLLTRYPWWYAMYDPQGEFYCRFDMWQYSCTGTVPGIATEVDLNVWVTD